MPASDWSDVDASARPARFVAGLDALRADPFFAAQKVRILEALELPAGEIVADVGSGTGEDAAELARAGCRAVGVERSAVLLAEARRRHHAPRFVAADARALPFGDETVSRVRVDRVLQHLDRPREALTEWRRVLRRGGALAVFEPDLLTARIEGLDPTVAVAVLRWRAGTRPGAGAVHDLAGALGAAGFADVRVDAVALDLDDLHRADGMMGLPEWGESAGGAGFLAPRDALRWRDDALAASQRGTLRYSCTYLHGRARAV